MRDRLQQDTKSNPCGAVNIPILAAERSTAGVVEPKSSARSRSAPMPLKMGSEGQVPLRLVTFNVRYATEHPSPGEERWSIRCPKLGAQLRFVTTGHSSAFLCLQEVLHSQLLDICSQLGSPWAHIGNGRDDGVAAGEFSPIFYRSDTWRCERSQTYWLSKTPETPSRGWDAALKRVVTMGLFRQLETGTKVVVMSTHFDHCGEEARRESAKLLLDLATKWQQDGGTPLFLGGDFNSTPDGGAYKAITAPGRGMTDISSLMPENRRYGNGEITYTSFGEPGETEGQIDFLFARATGNLRVVGFAILPNCFDDKIVLSDHRAVVADVEIPVLGGAP